MRSGVVRLAVVAAVALVLGSCSANPSTVGAPQDGAVVAEGGAAPGGGGAGGAAGAPGDPNVVAGGAGPSITAEAAALPTAPTVSGGANKPGTPTTTKVTRGAGGGVPTVPPQGGQLPGQPTTAPTTIPVPADDDPRLVVWCPLADETVQLALAFDKLTGDDWVRFQQVVAQARDFAPDFIVPTQRFFEESLTALLTDGRVVEVSGEAEMSALADEVLGAGSYPKLMNAVRTLLAYYVKNCGQSAN